MPAPRRVNTRALILTARYLFLDHTYESASSFLFERFPQILFCDIISLAHVVRYFSDVLARFMVIRELTPFSRSYICRLLISSVRFVVWSVQCRGRVIYQTCADIALASVRPRVQCASTSELMRCGDR